MVRMCLVVGERRLFTIVKGGDYYRPWSGILRWCRSESVHDCSVDCASPERG